MASFLTGLGVTETVQIRRPLLAICVNTSTSIVVTLSEGYFTNRHSPFVIYLPSLYNPINLYRHISQIRVLMDIFVKVHICSELVVCKPGGKIQKDACPDNMQCLVTQLLDHNIMKPEPVWDWLRVGRKLGKSKCHLQMCPNKSEGIKGMSGLDRSLKLPEFVHSK